MNFEISVKIVFGWARVNGNVINCKEMIASTFIASGKKRKCWSSEDIRKEELDINKYKI